jgi:hypothetical protein
MARKKIEEKEKINLAEAISEIKEKFGEGAK